MDKKQQTVNLGNFKITINPSNYFNPNGIINHSADAVKYGTSFTFATALVPLLTTSANFITTLIITSAFAVLVPLAYEIRYGEKDYSNTALWSQLPENTFKATYDSLRFVGDAATQIGSVYLDSAHEAIFTEIVGIVRYLNGNAEHA